MARGGLARLQQHEIEVNKLNVFTVADGDTGTNMCATLGNGIAYARPAERLSDYLKMLSEGMLLGARGNSGVILSQFFKGVYLALDDRGEADPKALAKALLQGSQTAYQSVIKPVEGTILTVLREGIENIKAPSAVEELLTRYIARMKRSLARTPDLLPVLRESGVIDSGGKGLIYIAEGMLMALTGEELPEIGETPVKQTLDFSLFDENSVMNEGYCTEFILQLLLAEGYRQDFDLNDFGTDGVFITAQKADDSNTVYQVEARAVIVNDSVETRTVTVRFSLEEPSRFDVPDHPYIKRYLRFDPESMYTLGGRIVKEIGCLEKEMARLVGSNDGDNMARLEGIPGIGRMCKELCHLCIV